MNLCTRERLCERLLLAALNTTPSRLDFPSGKLGGFASTGHVPACGPHARGSACRVHFHPCLLSACWTCCIVRLFGVVHLKSVAAVVGAAYRRHGSAASLGTGSAASLGTGVSAVQRSLLMVNWGHVGSWAELVWYTR